MFIAVGGIFGYSFSLQSLTPALIGFLMIIIGIIILIVRGMKKNKSQIKVNETKLEKRVCPACMTTISIDITECPTCGKKI